MNPTSSSASSTSGNESSDTSHIPVTSIKTEKPENDSVSAFIQSLKNQLGNPPYGPGPSQPDPDRPVQAGPASNHDEIKPQVSHGDHLPVVEATRFENEPEDDDGDDEDKDDDEEEEEDDEEEREEETPGVFVEHAANKRTYSGLRHQNLSSNPNSGSLNPNSGSLNPNSGSLNPNSGSRSLNSASGLEVAIPGSRRIDSDEMIAREVKDVLEYMLELVEVVVPFANKDKEPLKLPWMQDTLCSEDEKMSDDEIELLEDDSPLELIVELDPRPISDLNVLKSITNNLCYICGSSKKCHQAMKDGRIASLCSDECLAILKSTILTKCINCGQRLPADSITYFPKFGAIGSSICSQKCLSKYQESKGPVPKCRTCHKLMSNVQNSNLSSSSRTFHWQTMDFCSARCIERVLKSVGQHCVNCKGRVGDSALGKYSVRFGDVVRQFCAVKCLEIYKRKLKSCCFCQKELWSSSKVTIYFTENGSTKNRDFCNQSCAIAFKELRSKKMASELENGEFEEAEFCSICSIYVQADDESLAADSCKIEHNGATYFICSDNCLAALRCSLGIKSLICDGCHKYNWPLTHGTVLRFGGKIKIFCTKRCQSLFVLRTRKISPCSICRVKKYTFDLVEQFDHQVANTILMCSLNCLTVSAETDDVNDKMDKKITHAKCSNCNKWVRESVTRIFHLEDPQVGIRSFCSFPCIQQFKAKLREAALEAAKRHNAELLAKQLAEKRAANVQSSSNWTPNVSNGDHPHTPPGERRGPGRPRKNQLPDPSPIRHNYSTRTKSGTLQVHSSQVQPSSQISISRPIPTPNILRHNQPIRTQQQQQQFQLPNQLPNQPMGTSWNGGLASGISRTSTTLSIVPSPAVTVQTTGQKKTEVLLMKTAPKVMLNKCLQVCNSKSTIACQATPTMVSIGCQTESP